MRILVLRFSAFGDVAMTVPVVASVAAAWPDVEFVVAGRPFVKALFDRLAPNVRFEAVDLGQYKGLTGLLRLGWTLLKKYGFDAVADLHDVLRTKVLRTFFHLCGVKVAHIDKGRPEKRALTRSRHKEVRQLPTTRPLCRITGRKMPNLLYAMVSKGLSMANQRLLYPTKYSSYGGRSRVGLWGLVALAVCVSERSASRAASRSVSWCTYMG